MGLVEGGVVGGGGGVPRLHTEKFTKKQQSAFLFQHGSQTKTCPSVAVLLKRNWAPSFHLSTPSGPLTIKEGLYFAKIFAGKVRIFRFLVGQN